MATRVEVPEYEMHEEVRVDPGPFDLKASLRQTAFLFNGKITQSEAIAATA